MSRNGWRAGHNYCSNSLHFFIYGSKFERWASLSKSNDRPMAAAQDRQTAATARRTDATRSRSAVGTWVYVSTRHVSLRDCISYVIWEGGRCIRVSAADLHGCAAANSLLLQLWLSYPIEGVSFQLWFIPIDVTGNNPWLRIQNINIRMNNKIHSHGYLLFRLFSECWHISKQILLTSIVIYFDWRDVVCVVKYNPWLRIQNISIKMNNRDSFSSPRVWTKLSIMQLWFIPIEGVSLRWLYTIHDYGFKTWISKFRRSTQIENNQQACEKIEEMLQPKSNCINQDSRF